MEDIWLSIKELVNRREWYKNSSEAFEKLKDNNVILFESYIEDTDQFGGHVGRNGDIVVGIYFDNCIPVRNSFGVDNVNNKSKIQEFNVSMSVGGCKESQMVSKKPGEFTYFIEDKYPLPIIAVQYSLVRVQEKNKNYNSLRIIYALIDDNNLRRHLGGGTSIIKGLSNNIAILRGMYSYLQNENELSEYIKKYPDYNQKYITIPNMKEI